MPEVMRFLCPSGHVGFTPLRTGSFYRGIETPYDVMASDSGSCDVGPIPLATDTSVSRMDWQRRDLELMLLAAQKQRVPLIISSAGDTGTNSRVDLFVDIVKELAAEHSLPNFKLGYFYADVSKEYLRRKMAAGETIKGLANRPNLTPHELDKTDRIVAVAGIHPYVKLLDMGAEVIIGGRSSDCTCFAAPAIRAGFPEAISYMLGRLLESASMVAEPFGVRETVIGELSMEDVKLTPMRPDQRCTVASVTAMTSFERTDPFYEYVAGGVLDMSECEYEECDERATRITGPKFIPAEEFRVKLEGAAKVGERYIGIAGLRDPGVVAHIDEVIQWSRERVQEDFGEHGYEIHHQVFGRNGVMGALEPVKETRSHELCVVVQAVAPTGEQAREICKTATRTMLYTPLPEVKSLTHRGSLIVDDVLPAGPAAIWTMNHTVTVNDPLELFPVHLTEVGG